MIPGGDSENGQESGTFGVSLVFQRSDPLTNEKKCSTRLVFTEPKEENEEEKEEGEAKEQEGEGDGKETEVDNKDGDDGEAEESGEKEGGKPETSSRKDRTFVSPLSFPPSEDAAEGAEDSKDCATRTITVDEQTPIFNNKLSEKSWPDRIEEFHSKMAPNAPTVIGLALVSSKNVIFAMRETLSKLLKDFSRTSEDEESPRLLCNPLIELLGVFSHTEVEADALRCILKPYLQHANTPWLAQPGRYQDEEFDLMSGEHLLQAIPGITLALLYITILLEQKVIFSSSRRGMLLSAMTAITKLLDPFRWEHLIVPLVPSTLASDLLQYPAPFLLGLPSDDEGNIELLNTLPNDVTLVDLDVGRVILAPIITYDDDLLQGGESTRAETSAALRSQILYLAQGLGSVFRSKIQRQAWCVDSALVTTPSPETPVSTKSPFQELQAICHDFLTEMMAGTASCCFFIEEKRSGAAAGSANSTVLFDEDRFFHLKSLRAKKRFTSLFGGKTGDLALDMNNFDLVLECFLRCQSMSSHISSTSKLSMAFH